MAINCYKLACESTQAHFVDAYSKEDGKRGNKQSPRITVDELQENFKSWVYQVSKTTIRLHLYAPLHNLEGTPEKAFSIS